MLLICIFALALALAEDRSNPLTQKHCKQAEDILPPLRYIDGPWALRGIFKRGKKKAVT
jgi:hypothetical protein